MKCPFCKKEENLEFSPFCSRYCRDRDLLSWMNEGYRIPLPDESINEETEPSDDSENS